MAAIKLGENWIIQEDKNGDLVFKNSNTDRKFTVKNGDKISGIDSLDVGEIVNVEAFIETSNDEATVQSVIDSLSADGGGTVSWKSGTHQYAQATTAGGENTAIELKSNNNYIGQGYGTHLVQNGRDINLLACHYAGDASDNKLAGTVENIRVANMRLDGNKNAFSDFNTRQVNNVLWTPFAHRITLEKLWIHDVHQHGLHPDAVIDSTIRNCWIWDTDGQGIHPATRKVNGTVYGPQNLTIDNVMVRNTGASGIGINGDETFGTSVTNCKVENTNGDGISVVGRSQTVSGCYIRDAGSAGLNFHSATAPTAIGNSIENSSETGLLFRNVTGGTASGNTIHKTGNHGIVLDSVSQLSIGPTVVESPAAQGLRVLLSPRTQFTDLVIKGPSGLAGYIDRSPGSKFLNCTLHDCADTFLIKQSSTGCFIENITIRGSGGHNAIRILGDNTQINGVEATNNNETTNLLSIDAVECVVNNVNTDGTETTTINDVGTRTLVNGRGTNAGDPSSAGDWNGHADYAYNQNAEIRDTTNNVWYKPTEEEGWESIST